jgi:hypothetical protein
MIGVYVRKRQKVEIVTQGEAAGANGASRRRLLKTGLATTGAAYVAPQILKTSVAGAMTTTLYSFRVDPATGTCIGGAFGFPTPPAGSPCSPFPTVLGNAIIGGTLHSDTCPPSGSFSAVVGPGSVALTAQAGATFTFAGYLGAGCVWTTAGAGLPLDNATASAEISADMKVANFLDRGDFQPSDFLLLVISVTGSP